MHAGYPTGCGFDLTIDGRKPLKEWRIVSTSKRLAGEMNKDQCKHPLGFRHDELVGGGLAEKSGFYNLKMATAIVSSLCVRSIMNHVPQMPTVKGTIAHEEQGMWLAREVLALVNRPPLQGGDSAEPESQGSPHEGGQRDAFHESVG